jgi:hypothetical protein
MRQHKYFFSRTRIVVGITMKKIFLLKNMKKLTWLLYFLMALSVVGCASPVRAPAERDAAAKVFVPVDNKAVLFIYRNENFGAAIGMPIRVNGQDIGETGAKTFFRLNLSSGMYVIASEAENTSELPLTLSEGQEYYVWQEVRMGIWKARSSLRQVDKKTGIEGVLESALLTPKISEEDISKSAILRK